MTTDLLRQALTYAERIVKRSQAGHRTLDDMMRDMESISDNARCLKQRLDAFLSAPQAAPDIFDGVDMQGEPMYAALSAPATPAPTGEAVAEVTSLGLAPGVYGVGYPPILSWSKEVPVGTKLYAAPPAQAGEDARLADVALQAAIKTGLGYAQDAARFRDMEHDPLGYRHMLNLLVAGKGTWADFCGMCDRIRASRDAAIAAEERGRK